MNNTVHHHTHRLLGATLLLGLVIFTLQLSAIDRDSKTATISITRAESVKISDMNDWDMGSYSATSTPVSVDDRVCIFSSTGGYSLALTSGNGGTELNLLNAAGDQLRYGIEVKYLHGGQFKIRLLEQGGDDISGVTASSQVNCSDLSAGNWNLQLSPIINAKRFNDAPPGVYTDLVTLTVTPE